MHQTQSSFRNVHLPKGLLLSHSTQNTKGIDTVEWFGSSEKQGKRAEVHSNEGMELNKRPWFLLSPCRLYLETHHELLREHHLWNPQLDYVYPQHSTSPRPHSGHPQRVSRSLCRWAQRQSALLFKTGRRSITMNTLGSCSMENKWKFLSMQTGFVD